MAAIGSRGRGHEAAIPPGSPLICYCFQLVSVFFSFFFFHVLRSELVMTVAPRMYEA
jgi:hypothetical protein